MAPFDDGMTACTVCGKATLFPPTCAECEQKARGHLVPAPKTEQPASPEPPPAPRPSAAPRPFAAIPRAAPPAAPGPMLTFARAATGGGRQGLVPLVIFVGIPVAELIAGLALLITAFRRSSGGASPTAEPFDQAEKLASSEPFALVGAALLIAGIVSFRNRGHFIVAQVLILLLLSFLLPALRNL